MDNPNITKGERRVGKDAGALKRLLGKLSSHANLVVIAVTILAIAGLSVGTILASKDLERRLLETFFRTNSLVSTTTASHFGDYLESRANGVRSLTGVLASETSPAKKVEDIDGYFEYVRTQHVVAIVLLSPDGVITYSTSKQYSGRDFSETNFWNYVRTTKSSVSSELLSNPKEELYPVLPFVGSSDTTNRILIGSPIFSPVKNGSVKLDGAIAFLIDQFQVVPPPATGPTGFPDTTMRIAIGVLSRSGFPFIHLWSNDSIWNKQSVRALQLKGRPACSSCHRQGDIYSILGGTTQLGTGLVKSEMPQPASGEFLWSSSPLSSTKLKMQDSLWYVVVSADRGPVQASVISYLKGSLILMSCGIVLLVVILSLAFYGQRKNALERQHMLNLEQVAGLRGQYEVLIKNSNDGIYVLSEDRMVFTNKKLQEMLGYTPEEFSRMDFSNLVAPESKDTIAEWERKISRGEQTDNRFGFVAQSKDRKKIPVEVSLTQVQLEGRTSTIGILHDLTELTAQKQLFEDLFRSAPIGLAMYENFKVTRINDAAVTLLGYESPDELIGLNVLSVIHPEDLAVVGQRVKRAVEDHLPAPPLEERFVKKDGTVIHVLVLSRPVIYEGRDAIQIAFVSLEDRKKLEGNLAREAAMQEREKIRLSTLLQNLEEGILFQGPDGMIEFANAEFCRIFGFDSPLHLIGKPSKEILALAANRTKYPEEFVKRASKNVENKEYVRSDRLEFADGLIVDRSALPIVDSDGSYLGRVGVFRDITQREEKEETIKRLQRTELLGRLAGGIAHDFNNVLGIIIASLQMMMRKADNLNVVQENSQRALSSAIRGSEVAKRLLQFVRYSPETFKDFSVRQIIEETVSIIKHTFEENFIVQTEFIVNDATVYGSAGDIQQVLINLAKNAQDAMPDGGTLTISLTTADRKQIEKKLGGTPAGRYVLLMFQDTGQGIEADKLEKIFDPFYTTKDLGKGTGLGLSIVQTIISAHNGFIEVNSHKGAGTTFFIYLPMSEKDVRPGETVPVEMGDAARLAGSKTVLVVEDELALRELVCEFLSDKGFNVISAADGDEAFRTFTNHPEISLVLTDLGLPKMPGDKLIVKIRSARPEVKCVLATGYLTPMADSAMSNLDVKMIMKPYNLTAIFNLVAEELA
ncbi:MAG TPA: PAS domain S-box protein [Candidatus Kryptonia bacterium]